MKNDILSVLPAVSALACSPLFSGGKFLAQIGSIVLISKLSCLPYLARFARSSFENQSRMPISFQNWLWYFANQHVIIKASLLAGSVCPQGFDLAPKLFPDLELDSVNTCHLTRHAADGGESARCLDVFSRWVFAPTAANAHR